MPSILGALKRHFRDAVWAIRVPRSIQELALKDVSRMLRDSLARLRAAMLG
jgi:hypothetical protein